MKVDEFYCGRRVSNTLSPGPDLWVRSPRDEYHHCSYCGSLHPETFLKYVREGVKIGPTDKSYKFYIDLPGNHQLHPAPGAAVQQGVLRVVLQQGDQLGRPGLPVHPDHDPSPRRLGGSG
jgi:hypothetical protein